MNSGHRKFALAIAAGIAFASSPACFAQGYAVPSANDVVDLTPTLSTKLKQWWPFGHHAPQVFDYKKHGEYAYTADLLLIDNDTALQLDCPPHMMPPLDSGLPNAGYWGSMTCDKAPVWQMMGETVKVDGRSILDKTGAFESPVFTVDQVKAAERAIGRSIGAGDAVLYWSGYNDKHGAASTPADALIFDVGTGKKPAWPAPDWATQDYVGSKGTLLVGLDSPSIGAWGPPDHTWEGTQSYRSQTFKGLESHLGLFKYGGIDVESLVNLDKVPNGSTFIMLPVKLKDSPTAQARAIAVTNRQLAAQLNRAIKSKKVVDLSVLNWEKLPVTWKGPGLGNEAFPFFRLMEMMSYTGPSAPYWVNSQVMDSRTGTHITPPAHYGLPRGFRVSDYQGEVRQWAQEFERKYGAIKNTDMTSDKIPAHVLVGPARVVNVQALAGTTDRKNWPASPPITVADVQAHEKAHGAIRAGEIVIFHTGFTDAHFRMPERGRVEAAMAGPVNGETEGWPAATPEVIQYLAKKGVRHVAIDAPRIGSVVEKDAAMTFWAAANEGMVVSSYLIGAGQLPPTGAFYVFLNPKVENGHGGPGRAAAILPHK
ncbi:MAG: cyclase family protein [Burkholderiales bacterium]